jgi:two-component system, cell cycle sensor histidine kinase and response regulator CckA
MSSVGRKEMMPKIKAEEWLHAMLKSSPHAILVADGNGLIIMMNHTAEKLLYIKQKESLGKHVSDVVRLLDFKTRATIKLPTLPAFHENHQPLTFGHLILISANGKELHIEAIVTPLTARKSGVTGTALVFRDISKIIADEFTMMDTHKMAAIGTVAGSVAHNLSNWLALISGHASSIADNLLPNTRAHEEALKIINATKYAGGLAKRLLGIARASKTGGTVRTNQVALDEVVANAVNMAEATLPERHIRFKVKKLGKMPYVLANSDQLLDCLMNLFLNAADAMTKGGTVTIDAREISERNKNFVVLRVHDTGRGMSKEVLSHIFEPFFTTKEADSALGLGLTVVRNSLEQWGGLVKVWSKPNRGACFRLYIPRGVPQSRKEQKKPASAGGETVLVVDDDIALLNEIKNMLKEDGYKVLTASSGAECIAIFKKHLKEIRISAVDVVMPDKDGKSVLKSLREIDPNALIIMTSGFSRDYVRSYLERGVWGFLQKPIDRLQLLSLVRRMLDDKTAAATSATSGKVPS